MNSQVIKEYLVSSKSIEQLYPLRHADTVIIMRTMKELDTHSKLLLFLRLRLVIDYLEVVGCMVTWLLHKRHRYWYLVRVCLR